MAYFQKQEARNASVQYRTQVGRSWKTADQILRDQVRLTSDFDRFDIFLSHASYDAELILGVKAILEGVGFKVYVDWIDDAQLDRTLVTRDTADLLRRRMKQSKSLLWVATDAASQSKWMPWELGFFDGYRPNHIAILPLVDSATSSFQGQEYLSLYPLVHADKIGSNIRGAIVDDRGHETKALSTFVS
jgi:hypothetical protein